MRNATRLRAVYQAYGDGPKDSGAEVELVPARSSGLTLYEELTIVASIVVCALVLWLTR